MGGIEKDIPLPEPRVDYSAVGQLEIGESTTFEKRNYLRVAAALRYRSQTSAKKYLVRNVGGTVRVWRVA